MSTDLKPNQDYDHVYAILRIDEWEDVEETEYKVTVKKIMWNSAEADKEVERLNQQLKPDSKCHYLMRVTRLERKGT